jgi:hypothetical protein
MSRVDIADLIGKQWRGIADCHTLVGKLVFDPQTLANHSNCDGDVHQSGS